MNLTAAVPQREILWNVAPLTMSAVYIVSALCAAWIALWFVRRSALWKRGSVSKRPTSAAGIKRLVGYLATHRTIRRDPYAGLMHALIFWGFVVLLIATTLVGIQHHFGVEFLTGTTYVVFSLAADVGGVAFCAGVVIALWRRRSKASHGRLLAARSTTWMLVCLLAVGVSGFVVESARIAEDFPAFEVWSTAGYLGAKLLAAGGIHGESAVGLHRAAWIVHAVLVMILFAIVPVTMLKHVATAAYSVARPRGRPGVLAAPAKPIIAAIDLAEFRRFDLLQADACLTCGLCTEVCPAEAAGKPLSPRSVVLGIREHLDRPSVPLSQQVSDDALWSCTTCNACDVACPVNIHIVDKIVTLRRGRVAESALPATAADALESSAQKFNPFDKPNSSRLQWCSGLDVPVASPGEQFELLYWVGCAGAFDPDGREVARSMVQILARLGIKYRVLGCRERCTGDPARRLGEEGLWRELAETNRDTIAAHGVKSILTHCPHCYNAFQNEYPGLGPMPEVQHHSQWLRDRLADGTIDVRSHSTERLTFHDPCYLSRANDETEAPRAVLDGIAGGPRPEMREHGQKSFCCGGGGGGMWLDVRGRERVENLRAAQVEETGVQTVATACPFCRVMLEAGRGGLEAGQGNWRVKDISELVLERL